MDVWILYFSIAVCLFLMLRFILPFLFKVEIEFCRNSVFLGTPRPKHLGLNMPIAGGSDFDHKIRGFKIVKRPVLVPPSPEFSSALSLHGPH